MRFLTPKATQSIKISPWQVILDKLGYRKLGLGGLFFAV